VPRTFVTGDTHIPKDIGKLSSRKFLAGRELTKSDHVIVCGDFGLLWHDEPDREEQYWTRWLEDKPWTTLFLDGNHDNIPRLNALPVEAAYGSIVGRVSDSIFHLRRGHVYDIGDKRCFVMGGAMSTDRGEWTRLKYPKRLWWPEEVPSNSDTECALSTLECCGNEVDLVLTHTFPKSLLREFWYQRSQDPTCSFLQHVFENVRFKYWYGGHMHCDLDFREHSVSMLYNRIVEV
jgi:hypothetical protein